MRRRHWLLTRATLIVAIAGLGTTFAAERPQTAKPGPPQPPTTVLFMCPHGAAKSVLASAYFIQAAKARGLSVRVDSAGTEPDPAIASSVARRLTEQGLAIPITTPRRATAQDLEHADIVVSLGCDLSSLPTPRGTLHRWDDVPPPSENFDRADAMIRQKVMALVEELVRAERAGRGKQ
jgi:protein-tyrosine-phosphatase